MILLEIFSSTSAQYNNFSDLDEFEKQLNLFVRFMLDKLGTETINKFHYIDALIQRGGNLMNNDKIVKEVIKEFKTGINYDYFFKKIDSPDWIDPLLKEGFFKNPPEPIKSKVPYWPESQYLVRVADKAPKKVLSIILELTQSDNINVHQDCCEIAYKACNKSPELAKLAKEFALQEAQWISQQSQIHGLYLAVYENLIPKLIKSGIKDASYKLIKALLSMHHETKEIKTSDNDIGDNDIEISWYYKGFLNKITPIATDFIREDFLLLLIELMDKALQYKYEKPEDYSYVWYSSIKEGPNYDGEGSLDILVSGIRNTAQQMVEKKYAELDRIIQRLEKREWSIFKRLSLHMLRIFSSDNFELVKERLTNIDIFKNYRLHHEYFHLIKENYSKLDKDSQNRILGWIADGPDIERYKKNSFEELSEETIARYIKIWERDKLLPIKDFLPDSLQKEYKKIIKKYPEPLCPDYVSKSPSSGAGIKSPKEPQELGSMSISGIVAFLKSWEYSGKEGDPSPAGLTIDLKELVSSRPIDFSEAAELFIGLDPTYVRGFISGLEEHIRSKTIIWEPVLNLCVWSVNEPREIFGRTGEHHTVLDSSPDPSWVLARKRILNLLSDGLKWNNSGLEVELRDPVWKIIEVLTNDPDPTREYEKQYLSSTIDPASLSINTVRGQSFHTLIEYALWLRRSFEKHDNNKEILDNGLNEMPEVNVVLDTHLDLTIEPSLTVRSVYGRYFPYLFLLDSSWAKQNIEIVFPKNEKLSEYYDSAWETYITFNGPYGDIFKLLYNHYFEAVKVIGKKVYKDGLFSNPDECLTEHLIKFYWRNIIELDDKILLHFFQNSPQEFKKHALVFAGKELYNAKGEIDSNSQNRLQILWDKRIEEVDNLEDKTELGSFGYWFFPGGYDTNWEIDTLKKVLSRISTLDNDNDVIERLAKLASDMPVKTVECLNLMVKGAKGIEETSNIYWWRDDAKKIIEVARESPENKARKIAEEAANYFVTLGCYDFKDLF